MRKSESCKVVVEDGEDGGSYGEEGDGDEGEAKTETDQDRRRILLGSMSAGDAESVRSGGLRQRVMDEFILPPVSSSTTAVAGASNCQGQGSSNGNVERDSVKSTTTVQRGLGEGQPPRKKAKTGAPKNDAATAGGSVGQNVSSVGNDNLSAKSSTPTRSLAYGAIVQEEMSFRRKESLGLGGKRAGGTVGAGVGRSTETEATGQQPRSRTLGLVAHPEPERDFVDLTAERDEHYSASSLLATPDSICHEEEVWSCLVCTL